MRNHNKLSNQTLSFNQYVLSLLQNVNEEGFHILKLETSLTVFQLAVPEN